MDNIFVVGTDTGVGKTVLSLLLMQLFRMRGFDPFYLKPLQTGCRDAHDAESDAAFVYRHMETLRGKDPKESVIYCFHHPKAPLFAARDEGRSIDLQRIDAAVAEKGRSYTPLILEAAGGLLVPVGGGILMVDVIKRSGAKALLAARAGLGTINHTLLSLEALVKRGVEPLGVVFLDTAETPAAMVAENREAVECYSGIRVFGVIGRIADFSHPSKAAYHPLESLFPEGSL